MLYLPDHLLEELLVHTAAIDGASALAFGCSYKNIAALFHHNHSLCLVRCLLARNENSHVRALLRAAQHGNTVVVDLLCTGLIADVHAHNDDYAVRCAAQHRHTRTIDRLYGKFNSNFYALIDQALLKAAQNGHVSVVESLHSRFGADICALKDVALMQAAENGQVSIVEMMCVRFGADVHAGGDVALILAANYGHVPVVELLCGRFGADVHARDDLALYLAAQKGHAPVVKLLCRRFGAGRKILPRTRNEQYFHDIVRMSICMSDDEH